MALHFTGTPPLPPLPPGASCLFHTSLQPPAQPCRARAIFLHVISYNEAAMRLYGSSGYSPVARLPNFYHLVGRGVARIGGAYIYDYFKK